MKKRASGLVEVFAVLFVVGLLAAVAIPDFDGSDPHVRVKALATSLETARNAILRFKLDHKGVPPSLEAVQALSAGDIGPHPKTGFATYLDRIPRNPFTGGNRVGDRDTPVGQSDWIYDPLTVEFRANDKDVHRSL